MSAIFGIIRLDGRPVEPDEPARLHQVLRHRGPDGTGTWINGSAALGHLMLHTTPEALGEHLPWMDDTCGAVITADARLDNRDELFKDLGLSPEDKALSDSRLILHAYRKWRENCAEHLLGDFAFAVWEPASRRLYIARDGMGIRPFYYARTPQQFVFASSANAVVAAKGMPRHIDEGRVADLFVHELEGVDTTSTFYRSVYRMPPAHWGLFEGGRLSLHRYWRPDPERRLILADDREYVDGLEEVLGRSIKARMRCQRPAASMLSGGVDSSTIVGLAAKLNDKRGEPPFATFSGVSLPGEDCVESEYSRLLARKLPIDATMLTPDTILQFKEGFERVESVLEDPFDLNWILLQSLYLAARERGHVVIMDGIDGDGVASLTKLYPAYLARRGKLLTALREIDGQRAHFYRAPNRRLLFYWSGLKPALVPNALRRAKRPVTQIRWLETVIDRAAIRPEFALRAGLAERYRRYAQATFPGMMRNLYHAHQHRLGVPYLTAGIERYGRIAACCGVEARQPYHDRRVVEYCLAMPWNLKVRDGWSKFALRKVAERHCPPAVAWRPGWEQIGWKFNFARQAQIRGSNLALMESLSDELKGMLVPAFFTEIMKAYAEGRRDAIECAQNVIAYVKWSRGAGRNNKLGYGS